MLFYYGGGNIREKTNKHMWFFNTFIGVILTFTVFLGIFLVIGQTWQATMDDVCTKNRTISDTYYSVDLRKCVLIQCVNLQTWQNFNISNCYYDPPICEILNHSNMGLSCE